ncbi:MAG TPA: hypothetical protein VF041_11285 [Gemmatimonadaceae bacterium]
MSEDRASSGTRTRIRFSFRELGRVLVVPVIAVALFIFLFARTHESSRGAGPGGVRRITLATKDSAFHIVPPSRGGAEGSVWYTSRDSVFTFQLRATGLAPRVRYRLVLAVNEEPFVITTRAADARGALSIDTTLTEFAEGACVGDAWDPPLPLAGEHAIKFWLQRDGTPASGTLPATLPRARPGASLPCHGNGDGVFTYALLENEVANFAGREPRGMRGAERGARSNRD